MENHKRFLGFIQKRVGNREVAEEILQNAFVRGISREASIENTDRALPWFYRLLRNAIVDHFRSQARQPVRETLDQAEDVAIDEELEAVVCQCLGDLIPTLKEEYRALLTRVELDGLSVAEASAELGITANNGGVRLFRARDALKQKLRDACGTCTEHGCLDCTCKRSG